MPCLACGIKHIIPDSNADGNILYNTDKNSWTQSEIRKLEEATKHCCNDFCFFKGRKIYTYWVKDSRYILKFKTIDELIREFTIVD